jgi:hypothetical protein
MNRFKRLAITFVIVVIPCSLFRGGLTSAGEPELVSALADLKDHVDGTTPLNATQIENHKLTIDANSGIFGDSASIISASFDLVGAYDTQIGPIWQTGSPAAGGFSRNSVSNDIHWTVYNVMQNVMDETYTNSNIFTHSGLLDGFKFESADVFPGPVSPPANPNLAHTATIDGSFLKTFGHDTQHWSDRPARKPTGTYLAPGSIATITVPESLVGQGYQVRVGGHSWDLSNRPNVDRLDRSSLLYDIDSTEIQVASPLGGNIYVEVPYLANAGVVDVQIQNAARSPYFSAKSFDSTTLAEWQNTERILQAPWADFQTEKFMMHVPTQWIYDLDDPVTLMNNWDAAMDVVNDLMGFPRDRGKETMFPQVDVRFRASVFAPGYPSVNATYNPEGNYNGNHSHHLIQGPQFAGDYEFHEQGHAYFFQKFPGETESNVNLLHVAVQQQAFGKSWDEAFAGSRGYQSNEHRTLDNTAVAWMTSFNFSPREVQMHTAEKAYQLKGHAKFVEIAKTFGWGVLGDYWKSFNEDFENSDPIATDIDSLLLRLSKHVGNDIRPLFHFWGVHPQNPAALETAILNEGLLPAEEIYERLLEYKDLIPDDNTAFQTFALDWWGHQPSENGFWTESEHARQWDDTHLYEGENDVAQRPNGEIYDENSAFEIQGFVDELIELYFSGSFFLPGDFNEDEVIDQLDWVIFLENNLKDLGTSDTDVSFLLGDLDRDLDNDIFDFDKFRRAYEDFNGMGTFETMVAGAAVPEPASVTLIAMGLLGICSRCRRQR